MAVSKCAKCGGEISSHAKKCPHCGATKDEAIPQMADCAECGKEFNLLAEDECPGCGAPKKIAASGVSVEQTGRRGIVLPVIAAVIITAVVMAAAFYPREHPREPEGDLTQRILDAIPSAEEGEFPTPESAVEHYVKCLKDGDITSMAKVLMIKEHVTHLDSKKLALEVTTFSGYHGGNREYRHSKLISALILYPRIYDKMVWNMVTGMYWGETVAFNQGEKGPLNEEEQAQKFEEVFGPTRKPDLSGLEHEIGELEAADDEAKNYNRKNEIKWMKIYGADDAKTLNLIMKFDGESSALIMRLFKYGSNWKIHDIY